MSSQVQDVLTHAFYAHSLYISIHLLFNEVSFAWHFPCFEDDYNDDVDDDGNNDDTHIN